MHVMLRAGDSSLPRAGDSSLPRHRQALRIQTAPPGLVFRNFGKSLHQFLCMRACAWPRLTTTPQAGAATTNWQHS